MFDRPTLLQFCLVGAAMIAVQPAPVVAHVNPELIKGTWEQLSTRDLTTGTLEEIGKTRLTWLQFTNHVASQVWMTRDRAVVQPDELSRLSPDDRRKANYAKVWDEQGKPQFSGL